MNLRFMAIQKNWILHESSVHGYPEKLDIKKYKLNMVLDMEVEPWEIKTQMKTSTR